MVTPPSLKGRALRLLSGREHSRSELMQKLQPYEQSPGELARVLAELQAKGFIDEQRVIDSLIHRRSGKLGTARIRLELHAKGLSAESVEVALSGLVATELERARTVWQKKFGSPPQDAAQRARQMRFLVARGFSPEILRKVINDPDA